jgi:hypothetical protein
MPFEKLRRAVEFAVTNYTLRPSATLTHSEEG